MGSKKDDTSDLKQQAEAIFVKLSKSIDQVAEQVNNLSDSISALERNFTSTSKITDLTNENNNK